MYGMGVIHVKRGNRQESKAREVDRTVKRCALKSSINSKRIAIQIVKGSDKEMWFCNTNTKRRQLSKMNDNENRPIWPLTNPGRAHRLSRFCSGCSSSFGAWSER